MVRKDDCTNCEDKVWEVDGEPWYHPSTGMKRCATERGEMATPVGHPANVPDDLPGFPRPAATVETITPDEYGKGHCAEGRGCEDERCVKTGHPGVVPIEYLSDRERETVKLEPLVIAATEQFIDDGKWDAATEAPDTTYATVVLDLDDATDRAFFELRNVIMAKRADYAEDTDPWSNLRDIAAEFNGLPWEAANAMERNKLSRIRALKMNGRGPTNESVIDSYRDKANFAILAYAALLDEGDAWEGTK